MQMNEFCSACIPRAFQRYDRIPFVWIPSQIKWDFYHYEIEYVHVRTSSL